MSSELFDILSHSNKDIDNQKLMDYLSGKLSEKEKYELERLVAGNNFVQDALEGLESVQDPAKVKAHVNELKHDLQKQLKHATHNRKRSRIQQYPWIYLTIVLILVICVVGYLIIHQLLH